MSEFTVNRPLAAGAKNILDDLKVLDAKVTDELARGINEHYLEKSYVPDLAKRMGVEVPRVRTPRWVYVEWRQIQSTQVSAYDDDDAVQQVMESYGAQLSRGELPYGFRQSRWEDRESRNSVMVSEPTATRPNMDHDLRFFVERGNMTPRAIRVDPEPDPAAENVTGTDPEAVAKSDDFVELTLSPLGDVTIPPIPRGGIRWAVADGIEF